MIWVMQKPFFTKGYRKKHNMQKKIIGFILIGLGSLVILIFGYSALLLKETQKITVAQTPTQNIVPTTILEPVTTTSTDSIETPIIPTGTPFGEAMTFADNTILSIESEGKLIAGETNTSYGLFIQKPNKTKKLLASGISSILLSEGSYFYTTTTNPNINFLKTSWGDGPFSNTQIYVINTANETILQLQLLTNTYSTKIVISSTVKDTIELSHINECGIGSYQTDNFQCNENQELIYDGIQLNGKTVLPLKNIHSQCGGQGAFDDTCIQYLAPSLQIAGVDTTMQKIYFNISQYTNTYHYVLDIAQHTITPTNQSAPISLVEWITYTNGKFSLRYPSSWSANPNHTNEVIIQKYEELPPAEVASRSISIRKTEQSLSEFIAEYNKGREVESSQIEEQNSIMLNGIKATHMRASTAIGIDRQYIFVPEKEGNFLISYPINVDKERDAIISTIKLVK